MAEVNYKRQLFHLFLGISLFFLLRITSRSLVKLAIFFPILFGLYFIMRIKKGGGKGMKKIAEFFNKKDSELGEGAFFFLLGIFFTLSFFSKNIALISILVLSISDPIATYVGSNFGKINLIGSKTFFGTIAFFLSTLGILILYKPVLVSILVAAPTSIFELTSEKAIDDNLIIPLVVASILSFFL